MTGAAPRVSGRTLTCRRLTRKWERHCKRLAGLSFTLFANMGGLMSNDGRLRSAEISGAPPETFVIGMIPWRGIGFAQSDLANFAGPGHWNDPDMLEIGNGGMSPDEYKTHFSLWSMIAAPLIGNDVRQMGPDITPILLNKEVIAVDQDPLGAGGKQVKKLGDIEIWQKPLATGDIAIAIFNRSDQETRTTIPWNDLAIGNSYAVRDLWAHSDRGAPSGVSSQSVPAHGVVMFRLKKHTGEGGN